MEQARRRVVEMVAAAALGVTLAITTFALAPMPLEVGEAPQNLPTAPRLLTAEEVALSGAYVALGDSYSSGEGVWVAERDGGDPCHRSKDSYFAQVAAAHPFAGGAEHWACSGATTRQLLNGQFGQAPQIDRVAAGASLVTLSIGGNDAGFSTVLQACIAKLPWSTACTDQDAAVNQRIVRLRASVLQVLGAIRARAPLARVIVLGYPRPFPAEPGDTVDNLGVDDQRWINGVARRLNDAVKAATAEYDRGIAAFGGPGSAEYVDAYDAFDGHEVGRAQPYVNGLDVDLGELTVKPDSYHPTGDGYRRFGELINRQIAAGPGRPMGNAAPPPGAAPPR